MGLYYVQKQGRDKNIRKLPYNRKFMVKVYRLEDYSTSVA